MTQYTNSALELLISKLHNSDLSKVGVIPWSCPVPVFGDPSTSKIATLGINPSNREFVDSFGNELIGPLRRFHTLRSLGLSSWSLAKDKHLHAMYDSCISYFSRNPYNTWFRALDELLVDADATYYGAFKNCCHLDLVPYATTEKWGALGSTQQTKLLDLGGDALGLLLKSSPVQALILNGTTVVEGLSRVSNASLDALPKSDWSLPRKTGAHVSGFAYVGTVSEISGITLSREVMLLGFNHNIQSSFGVTTKVKSSIRKWIGNRIHKASI